MAVIKLEIGDSQKFQQAANALGQIRLDLHELSEALREWESRPTIASKRIFSSLSVLLAAAYFFGVDFGALPFMGIAGDKDGGIRLSVVLFLGLISTLAAHLWNRSIDKKVKGYALADIGRRIESAEKYTEEMRAILNPESIFQLKRVRVVEGGRLHGRERVLNFKSRPFDLLLYYHCEVKGQERRRRLFENVELYLMLILASYGFMGLVDYWICYLLC